MKTYAILADIHGNIRALEAVLEDAARRGVRNFLNLGDTVYGPLDPGLTAARLMELPLVSVQGNEDRLLWEPVHQPAPTLDYTRRALSEAQQEWLARTHMPATVVDKRLFLCHGTPNSDSTYLVEEPSEQGGFLKGRTAIEAELADITEKIILCGHSHMPRVLALPGGRLVINPGSVGLQAYTDDRPAHKMETGSPHARYTILSETAAGWQVEQIAVPYAWDKAARQAQQNGRPDWAKWLESGRA